jgi:hypothetical protein
MLVWSLEAISLENLEQVKASGPLENQTLGFKTLLLNEAMAAA